MINQITELSERLSGMFTDENREHLTFTLKSARNIAEMTEKDLKETLSTVQTLSSHTEKVLIDLDTILVSKDSALTESVTRLNELLAQSGQTVTHVNDLLTDLDYGMDENKVDVKQILDNLNSMTRNLNEFSQTLKEKPWSAIRKDYPPKRKAVQ